MHGAPSVYIDRCPAEEIARDHPGLWQCLFDLGAIRSDLAVVRFCGLVLLEDGTGHFFVPRNLIDSSLDLSGSEVERMRAIHLTVAALSKFQKNSSRDGLAESGSTALELFPVILALSKDFLENGLFSERTKMLSRNHGRTDWARTIKREHAFLSSGYPVYVDLVTSRPSSDFNNELARIQALVISEIFDRHWWWLGDRIKRPPPESAPAGWRSERSTWLPALRRQMGRLYSQRALRLASLLCDYLEVGGGTKGGPLIAGLCDFHTVWEEMLKSTLKNVETGWNRKLPQGYYLAATGQRQKVKGMMPDIVLRTDRGLEVLDAKYYSALTVEDSPGLGDIIKQMSYLNAVRDIEPDTAASTCFVFPRHSRQRGAFTEIHFETGTGIEPRFFPSIDCEYLVMGEVMENYVQGTKTNFVRRTKEQCIQS